MAAESESMRARENVSARPTAMYACTPASGNDTSPAGGAGAGARPRSWPASGR
jgi:hypothetical protein